MPKKVQCAHILVKTEKEAEKALQRLTNGEKFANMGDLGAFGRGKTVKAFEQAAFTLKKGEISPITKTKFGYHIIKRLD
jgi:parvulin-like peptidyl-prolyl isomerase